MAMPEAASVAAPETEGIAPEGLVQDAETVQDAPVTDPFEGMSDEEIVANPRLRGLVQSRSDRLLGNERARNQASQAAAQQEGQRSNQENQMQAALTQLRGMTPESVHESLITEVESQLSRSQVSGPLAAQAQQQANVRVLQALVGTVSDALGDMTSAEREALDPNKHDSLPSYMQAVVAVTTAREKGKAAAQATEAEKKAAATEARREARERAPIQEVGQGQAGPNTVDVGDLKGSGDVFEGMRRQRLAGAA